MRLRLTKTLAGNAPANPNDVGQAKKALNRAGYYRPLESIGITEYPDRELFDALERFQRDHGLRIDGRMRPDGESVRKLSHESGKARSGKYIWRTAGDSKVRSSHAALDGTVRDWSQSPTPGEEPGCRCWSKSLRDNQYCINLEKRIRAAWKEVRELNDEISTARFLIKDKKRDIIELEAELAGKTVESTLKPIFGKGKVKPIGPLDIIDAVKDVPDKFRIQQKIKSLKEEIEAVTRKLNELEKERDAKNKEAGNLEEEHRLGCSTD